MASYTIPITLPAGESTFNVVLPQSLITSEQKVRNTFVSYVADASELNKSVFLRCDLIGNSTRINLPNYIACINLSKPEYTALQKCEHHIILKSTANISFSLYDVNGNITTLVNDMGIVLNIY